MKTTILNKIRSRQRLSFEEGLSLNDFDLFTLSKLADSCNKSKEVSFIVNRMINYSNICQAKCTFCAFHAKAGVIDSYRLTDDEILNLCEDAQNRGAIQIMLQGGVDPSFDLTWAKGLLAKIKNKYPKLKLHAFSPTEIVWFAKDANKSIFETVSILKEAGLDSMPGAADLLLDDYRKTYCANKCTTKEWTDVMKALAKLGMTSSATMTFGMGETFAHRLKHMDFVRNLQDELNVFKAFISWPLALENTAMPKDLSPVGTVEFLRTLAISRIYLDNIDYIQSGWLTEGLKVAELALYFGANDIGGVLMDELVVKAAGIENKAVSSDMINIIKNANKIPRQRDFLYNSVE